MSHVSPTQSYAYLLYSVAKYPTQGTIPSSGFRGGVRFFLGGRGVWGMLPSKIVISGDSKTPFVSKIFSRLIS